MLFREVYNKLPRQYRLDYGRWVSNNIPQSKRSPMMSKQIDDLMTTSNLLEWMETQLRLLRREASIFDIDLDVQDKRKPNVKPTIRGAKTFLATIPSEPEEPSEDESKPIPNDPETPEKKDETTQETQLEEDYDSDTGHSFNVTEVDRKCLVCNDEHWLRRCPKFLEMTPANRRKIIIDKKMKICFNCLGPHISSQCKSKFTCMTALPNGKCGRKHHTLLHGSEEKHQEPLKTNAFGITTKQGRISLRVLPLRFINKRTGESLIHNALLDDGAQNTIISEDIKNALDLKGKLSTYTVSGVGGKSNVYKRSMVTKFIIQTLDGKFSTEIEARVIPSPLGSLEATSWKLHQDKWNHLKDINFPDLQNDTVDVLIGGQHAHLIASLKDVIGEPGDPVARLCKLGWTALGPLTPEDKKEINNSLINLAIARVFHLTEQQADSFSDALTIQRSIRSPELRRNRPQETVPRHGAKRLNRTAMADRRTKGRRRASRI